VLFSLAHGDLLGSHAVKATLTAKGHSLFPPVHFSTQWIPKITRCCFLRALHSQQWSWMHPPFQVRPPPLLALSRAS